MYLKDFAWFITMAIRTTGILYLFYLQYINSIDIPILIIILISMGSLGTAIICNDVGKHSFERKLLNYTVGLFGIIVLLNEYM